MDLAEEYEQCGLGAYQPYYDKLLLEHPKTVGSSVSSKERRGKTYTGSKFVYGEIRFDSFSLAIHKVRIYGGLKTPGGIFYDLGSGIGKPCFAAALLHDFDKVYGIEMLPGLNKVANDILVKWNELVGDKYAWKETQFICSDLCTFDWTDATVVFANSTCFTEELMAKIAEKALSLKKGTFFITFTKALPNVEGFWYIHEAKSYTMSWGPATVYIQEKIR
eukprot:GSMAST32.ASY1.ANO1.1955.1 assembled CDS